MNVTVGLNSFWFAGFHSKLAPTKIMSVSLFCFLFPLDIFIYALFQIARIKTTINYF